MIDDPKRLLAQFKSTKLIGDRNHFCDVLSAICIERDIDAIEDFRAVNSNWLQSDRERKSIDDLLEAIQDVIEDAMLR